MKVKAVSGIMLTLLLTSMLILAFNIQPVKASGTICIRADGSVDPPTANITSVDNVTYTFTDNIYDSIVVERDDIVVDGAGYTLQGTGSGTGIYLSERNNVTIKNMEIKAFFKGIQLVVSSNSIVIGNRLTNNLNGIAASESEAITVQNNTIEHCNNLGIHLIFSANCIITNNTLKYFWYVGVSLDVSSGNRISQNTMSYGYIGIGLDASGDNNINKNRITNTQWGVVVNLYGSSNNILRDNKISNNYFEGIRISYWANNNTICNNTVTSNREGISVWFSNNSVIVYNTISENDLAIKLERSSNNIIHHNIFMNNVRQVSAWDNTTMWDDGYPSGGNYWSDYEERYPDAEELNDSGIWDTPYVIDANNQDNYPLVEPWTPTIKATVDIDPNTLNLKSIGEWITCYIELPEGYNVSDIDIYSIMLNNTFPISLLVVPPVLVPREIGDYDEDRIPDLMVKFNRTTLTSHIYHTLGIEYGNVTLTITGQLTDGTPFEGSDVIMVRMPGDVDDDGDVDPFDLGLFAGAYGTSLGDTYYKWAADFNEDGSIDPIDLCIFGAYYGETAV